MIACIETFTAGIAILWPSLKSLIDLIDGSRDSRMSGDTLRPDAARTSIGVPFVLDQIVMMPGMPRQTKSTLPDSSASFITSLDRNWLNSAFTSPRPAALACFSIIFWSSMTMNCM